MNRAWGKKSIEMAVCKVSAIPSHKRSNLNFWMWHKRHSFNACRKNIVKTFLQESKKNVCVSVLHTWGDIYIWLVFFSSCNLSYYAHAFAIYILHDIEFEFESVMSMQTINGIWYLICWYYGKEPMKTHLRNVKPIWERGMLCHNTFGMGLKWN